MTSGTATLKDATSEAIRDWVTNVETTHYILGSAAGPHPYPMMVSLRFAWRHGKGSCSVGEVPGWKSLRFRWRAIAKSRSRKRGGGSCKTGDAQ